MNRTAVAQNMNSENVSSHSHGILQRKCASCSSKTTAEDECTECANKKGKLQRKLAIGASNDPLEHEADRVADQVMSMSPNSSISSLAPRIQRASANTGDSIASIPPSVNHVLSNPGSPMQSSLRKDMEHRFGQDFSRVRVHTGPIAEKSANEINANAYTAGQNVVFGKGQYSPETYAGQKLFAHELTHVIQQNGAAHQANIQRNFSGAKTISDDIKLPLIIQRQETDASTVAGTPTSTSTQETNVDSVESIQTNPGQLEEIRPGTEPRILISCQDMRFQIVTPQTIYSYKLAECSIPLDSYVAIVTVTGDDFYLNFGDGFSAEQGFAFRYIVDPGQENPATLLEEIERIQVDVVENLAAPRPRTEEERQTPPTSCIVRLPERVLIPSNSETRSLFETKTFDQTIWAHPIPLGQFGWVEVEATADGSLSGSLSGSYGPGRLTDICLTHTIDRNSSSSEINHPLLGDNSAATHTSFWIGGRARFRLPARAAANLSARGGLRIAGDYLSVIELAAAEAALSASANASLTGTIDASVDIVARVSLSEAYLESAIPLPVPGTPFRILPSLLPGITLEDISLDGVDLAAEIGLKGNAGVSFRGDLSAGFDLLGINLWSQSWNLANFDAGISWTGGLRYSPNPGIHWDLGVFNADDEVLEANSLPSDMHEGQALINEEDIIESILKETEATVTSPDGSDESNALPFDWFKPASLYPNEMYLPNAIAPTSVGRFDGPTPVRFPTNILPSRDRRHYGLPRSSASDTRTELEEDIGVADWPSVRRTFQYMPYDSRSDPEKERFKRLVDVLGFNRAGFDADHIWELGLQGAEYDRFDNLWPGSNQEQQLAGARHFRQMQNYQNTLGNINGRWFVISRIRHPA